MDATAKAQAPTAAPTDAVAHARFGRLVRDVRRARGLTQSELAGLIGTSTMTLARIERGKTGTGLAEAVKLARVLDLEVDLRTLGFRGRGRT